VASEIGALRDEVRSELVAAHELLERLERMFESDTRAVADRRETIAHQ
jgi:hypothetical protein